VVPSEQTVNVLETTCFMCITNSEVRWNYEGGKLPINAVAEIENDHSLKHKLTLYNTVLDNAGTYTCQGIGKERFIFEDKGILRVKSESLYKNNCRKLL